MGNITRDQLVNKHDEIVNKMNELKAKEYAYKTAVGCDGFGMVKHMSIGEIIEASVDVHECTNSIERRIEQYGITQEDLEGCAATEYQGYPIEDWDHDFKLRVEQIHDERTIAKCEQAIAIMEKHFTEDDRFKIDMTAIEGLL